VSLRPAEKIVQRTEEGSIPERRLAVRFWREESAATMVEYAIMVALIAAVALAVIKVVGQKTNNGFGSLNSAW
jgi:pilus assembly protein Flp/PilA